MTESLFVVDDMVIPDLFFFDFGVFFVVSLEMDSEHFPVLFIEILLCGDQHCF